MRNSQPVALVTQRLAVLLPLAVSICFLGLAGGGRSSDSDGDLLVNDATCTDRALIMVGGERGEYLPGDARLYREEAVAVRVGADTSRRVRALLGEGFATSVSGSLNGWLLAVRRSSAPPNGEVGHLLISRDGGRTFDDSAKGPPDIVGVAVESRDHAFAWSSETIYRTTDGGKSWKSVRLKGYIPRGRQRPVSDGKRGLVVLLQPEPTVNPRFFRLVRVADDLTVKEVKLPTEVTPEAVDAVAPNRIYLVGAAGDRNHLFVSKENGGVLQWEQVSEVASGLPIYFRAGERSLIISTSEINGEVLNHSLHGSFDGGKSWSKLPPPASRPRAYCYDPVAEHLWMVNGAGDVNLVQLRGD